MKVKTKPRISELELKLRSIAAISVAFSAPPANGQVSLPPMFGYSGSTITYAVCKEPNPPELARDQIEYMDFLGDHVCPRILAIGHNKYCMEFLQTPKFHTASIIVQENILKTFVWSRKYLKKFCPEEQWRAALKHIDIEVPDWALEEECVIHGDPTLDNTLITKKGFIRITDPIPPKFLNKPCIKAVDCGKMLQSFLGWETVLRGTPYIEYDWPKFMEDKAQARRSLFWCGVALRRLIHRNINHNASLWATRVILELEEQCEI